MAQNEFLPFVATTVKTRYLVFSNIFKVTEILIHPSTDSTLSTHGTRDKVRNKVPTSWSAQATEDGKVQCRKPCMVAHTWQSTPHKRTGRASQEGPTSGEQLGLKHLSPAAVWAVQKPSDALVNPNVLTVGYPFIIHVTTKRNLN